MRLPIIITIILALPFLFNTNSAIAQFDKEPAESKGSQLGKEHVQKWQAGVKIEAVNGPAQGLNITVPVPTDWPEQTVKVIEEDVTGNCAAVASRFLDGGVKQMLVQVPRVMTGNEARAILTFEVTTHAIAPPEDTSILVIPKRSPRQVTHYLGPSPMIDSRHSILRKKAKEILDATEVDSDWEKVKLLYDWTQKNVTQEGDSKELRGTLYAIRKGKGNAEDVVGVFIALCRASKIPARMVWVQGHFYAEFYMQDDEKKGHWFPAELIGADEFGTISNPKPILQKGDNIFVPELKKRTRFVAEHLKGKKIGARPKVTFIREMIAN